MKICILTTGHAVLDSRIFYKEALTLKKKFNNLTIIAPSEKKHYTEKGIDIIGVKNATSLLDRFKLAHQVVKKAIELNADIYHFHDFELIYWILKIKKYLPNAKIIYDVHESYPDMARMSHKLPLLIKPIATFFIDKSELFLSKKFDFIITADDAVKERFNGCKCPVEVIYNFSDFKTTNRDYIKKQYDVIYQGGITIERGVFNTVKAIEHVKKIYPNVKMVFLGSFDEQKSKEMVFKYIADHNLCENIQFIGKVPHEQVEEYVRKSRIGIVTLLPFPKYYKNIPIKQFEYMSCGIPVIGSNLPPIKKFILEADSGVIVDATAPNEIANSIIKLLYNDEERERLGKNGINAIKKFYNWRKMEDVLYRIYEKLGKLS